jgi:hypothetical protein
MKERLDILGAWVAHAILVLSSLVFVVRLAGRPQLGYWIGLVLLLVMAALAFIQRARLEY